MDAAQDLDLTTELATAHAVLRELLEAAGREGPPDDPRAPVRALDAFVVGLCEHLGAEGDVLHPAARRLLDDGAKAVAGSVPCHRALQRRMRVVEQHVWGDARTPPAAMDGLRRELARTFDEHVRHDERLAARVDAAVDADARAALVERFRRASTRAPTRPHPHVPQSGPLARPLRRLAGRWDDVLDAVDVRPAAGRRPTRSPRPLGLWGGYVVGRPPDRHPEDEPR